MPRLSLVVIARDEEEDLPSCLDSVQGLADELIVVDDRSTDRTAALAAERGAEVVARAFDSYAGQKQFAVEQASGDWILSLDADERLSPELKDEIRRVLAAEPAVNGFRLPFEAHFQGRVLRFSGLGAERHVRLFRRGKGRFTGGLLHEGLEVAPPLGRLRARVIHRPYRDLDEYFAKLERYTDLAARKMFQQGRKCRWHDRWAFPAEFLKRYVFQLGFLDGAAGLTWCRLCALYRATKFRKLRALERAARSEKKNPPAV